VILDEQKGLVIGEGLGCMLDAGEFGKVPLMGNLLWLGMHVFDQWVDVCQTLSSFVVFAL
jgi:hypothetical protein